MKTNKTALVLIDLQKEDQFHIENMEKVIQNAQIVLELCRKKGIPVIYTRQINRHDGQGLSRKEPLDKYGKPVFYRSDTDAVDILDEIGPQEGDIIVDKYRWSGFYQTHLDLILREKSIDSLIIGGFVTDGCLMTSVFDGYFRDYQINLVEDMCGASNEGAHMASILLMCNWVYGIRVFQTEELRKKFLGEPHVAWEFREPDQLHFTGKNLREVFQKNIKEPAKHT